MSAEELAKLLGDHFGQHRWDHMAEDRADLRLKMREMHAVPFDINEPTRADCREAAAAVQALLKDKG